MKKPLAQFWNEIKKIDSTPKKLREFGMVMGVFFLILSGFAWWRGKNFLPFLSIAGIFLTLTYLKVQILKPLQKFWMGFALIMGFFMTRIILAAVFYLALTPISIIARFSKKQFLDLDFDRSQETYWIQKPSERSPKEHYERQF